MQPKIYSLLYLKIFPIIPHIIAYYSFIVLLIYILTIIIMISYWITRCYQYKYFFKICIIPFTFTIIMVALDNLRDFIAFSHHSSQLFLYYFHECPVMLVSIKLPSFILKIIPTQTYKIMLLCISIICCS